MDVVSPDSCWIYPCPCGWNPQCNSSMDGNPRMHGWGLRFEVSGSHISGETSSEESITPMHCGWYKEPTHFCQIASRYPFSVICIQFPERPWKIVEDTLESILLILYTLVIFYCLWEEEERNSTENNTKKHHLWIIRIRAVIIQIDSCRSLEVAHYKNAEIL